MLWWLPLVAAGAYLLGRVLHELTHAAVVVLIPGARVEALSLSGCWYQGVSERGKAVVDGATIPGFLVLVTVVEQLVDTATLAAMLPAAALYLAYLPRSDTDWRPWRRLAGRLPSLLSIRTYKRH